MKIILTGATGFVGAEVLRQALDDATIEQVTVLNRRSVGLAHAKLKEIVLDDFLDYYSGSIWVSGSLPFGSHLNSSESVVGIVNKGTAPRNPD